MIFYIPVRVIAITNLSITKKTDIKIKTPDFYTLYVTQDFSYHAGNTFISRT